MRVCLALLVLLVLTPAASAATVRMTDRVERDGGQTSTYGSIEVAAAAGEVNTVELSREAGGVVIRDATATLQGDARCRNADPHTIVCRDPELDGITELYVELGDGADRARTPAERGLAYVVVRGGPGDDDLAGAWATFEGGDGDDRLVGGTGTEHLDGGAGNDVLEGHAEGDYLDGGTGDDVVRGGDGHDSLYGGGVVGDGLAAGADLLDGGPGNDSLDDQDGLGGGPAGPDALIGGDGRDFVYSYVLRRRGVTVDLTRPDGHGERGENDSLAGIEDVYGGSGDDTLIGDAGPNRLEGNRGEDELRGGGGDDHLVSVAASTEQRPNARAALYGPDRVSGDAGDDLIETQATLESQVTCGDGTDRVVMPGFSADRAPSSRGPLVSRTCERLAMGGSRRRGRGVSVVPYPTAMTRNAFTFRLHAFDCCRQRMELQTVERRPRVLAGRTLRSKTLRLRVRGAARHTTLRGKITNVARNRFVWRFRRGF